MKNVLFWLVFNIIDGALVWYGLVQNVEGAANLLLFITWLSLIVTSICAINEVRLAIVKDLRYPSVPYSLNVFVDVAFLGALVWYGWWVTSVIWLLQIVIGYGNYNEVMKIRNNKEEDYDGLEGF